MGYTRQQKLQKENIRLRKELGYAESAARAEANKVDELTARLKQLKIPMLERKASMDKDIESLEMVLRWWKGTKQCFTKKDNEWIELCEGERAICNAIMIIQQVIPSKEHEEQSKV
jgi:hypothetical protein